MSGGMAAGLGFAADLGKGLFSSWLSQKAATGEAEKAGAAQQAATSVENSNATIGEARAASDATIAAGVRDPGSLRAPDPDSRD